MRVSDNTIELRSLEKFISKQCEEIEDTTELYRAKMVKQRHGRLEKLSAIELNFIKRSREFMKVQGTLLEALAVEENNLKGVANDGFKQHQKGMELAILSLQHQI